MNATSTRDLILAEARTWLKTPFHHRAKLKGVGVDCVNFVVEVYRAVDPEFRPVVPLYGRTVRHGGAVTAEVAKWFVLKSRPLPGDLGVFRMTTRDQHLAIFTDYGLIHADGTAGVVEHRFSAQWPKRLVAVYRLPSLEEDD